MGLIYIRHKTKKRKKLPLTDSLIKAREEHAEYLKSIGFTGVKRKDYTAFNDVNIFNTPRRERQTVVIKKKTPVNLGNGGTKPAVNWRLQESKKFTVAPAYNKGAYQVISKDDVKDIGK
jgi:hypothetical protein